MRTYLKMETSRDSYQHVQIHSEDENVTAKPWKIIQRQVLVSSAVWSSFFTLGLLFGTPTVYIAQRRREENSTEAISIEMASWISSAHTYSAIPFFIIMAALSKYFGRKKTYLIACSIYFVGFMTIYLSKSVIEILIGECILGALLACDWIICGMVITEYTSSRYRGFFLTFKSATFAWGILVANLIGIFIDWRPIALLACMCSAYSFIVGLMWPESPYWLISNKDHNACSESHYWLKGKTEESKRELKELIKAHQKLIQVKRERTGQHKAAELIKNLFSKTFYRFFSYSVLIAGLYSFSGKMACNVYAIQIIKSVIDNDSVANKGTLIVDAVCVIGMYFASFVVKFYKRKHMLLITSSTGILFLFLISAYVYLTKWELINENKYVFLFLLTMYMIAISCGPIALSPTLIAELCPLRYRGFYMWCNGLSGNFILGTMVKFTPYLFSSVGPHGAFLFYGVSSLFFLTLIYYFVPETKDKTIIVEMSYLMNQ